MATPPIIDMVFMFYCDAAFWKRDVARQIQEDQQIERCDDILTIYYVHQINQVEGGAQRALSKYGASLIIRRCKRHFRETKIQYMVPLAPLMLFYFMNTVRDLQPRLVQENLYVSCFNTFWEVMQSVPDHNDQSISAIQAVKLWSR